MSRSSHNPPHPRAWDLWGNVGRRGRLQTPTTGSRRSKTLGAPVDSEAGRDVDLIGAEHPQSPLTPRAGSPGPPGPPCRPTGPSSRALLLAGVRRASSKFLLTLAAPVSLPAAGSVLGGGKGSCHLDPTEQPHDGPQAVRRDHVPLAGPHLWPGVTVTLSAVDPSDPPAQVRVLGPQASQGRAVGLWPKSSSPSLAPAHFFSFSPTAGDAAGLASFSRGGDGE